MVATLRKRSGCVIASLRGRLASVAPPMIVVDVGGVGYELQMSMRALGELPGLGETVSLITHLVVREDSWQLFGFKDGAEKLAFLELVKVTGLGARTAMSVLSSLSPGELATAVAREDPKPLLGVPGIGKKSADRIILELRGKLDPGEFSEGADEAPFVNTHAEIIRGMVALGYKEKEAFLLVKELPPDVPVAEGIRLALKAAGSRDR